jgi:hypothetical protein
MGDSLGHARHAGWRGKRQKSNGKAVAVRLQGAYSACATGSQSSCANHPHFPAIPTLYAHFEPFSGSPRNSCLKNDVYVIYSYG